MNIQIINVIIDIFQEYGESIRFDEERLAEAISDEAPDLIDEAYLVVEGMRRHVFDALIFDEERDERGYVDYLVHEAHFDEDEALFMIQVFSALIDYYQMTFEIPQIDQLVKEARDQQSLDHLFAIGKIYFTGFGVRQDYEKAFTLMLELYSLGDDRGAYYLGYMYEFGYGVEQDLKKAFLYYTSSQDDLCLLRLGMYYYEQEDDDQAITYLSRCHLREGFYYYGVLLERKHCYSDAFQAFFQGAKLYKKECLYKVGMYLLLGLGTDMNQQEAYHYFIQGYYCLSQDCAYQLAMILFDGIVVKKDEKKALRYLYQAAQLGSQAACFKLAYFYSQGQYVNKDINQANKYYQQARILGE